MEYRTWEERASGDHVGLVEGSMQRSAYLGQDLLGKGLWDLEEIGLDAGLLETLLLGFSELLNVSTTRQCC